MNQKQEKNKFKFYSLIFFFVMTGSANTILNKYMLSTKSKDAKFGIHPWFITFGMFIGESFSLILFYFSNKKNKIKNIEKLTELKDNVNLINSNDTSTNADNSDKKKIAKYYIFILPALCDFFGSTIATFGLVYLSSSIYQMMRGILIIFVMILSILILKSKMLAHNYLGALILIIGLILTGISPMVEGDDEENSEFKGIILIIISQIFSAIQYVVEEKIVRSYIVDSFQMVGFEGMWGSIVYIVVLIIFQFIKCNDFNQNLKENICAYRDNYDGNIYLEDTNFALKQMIKKKILILLFILYITSIGIFNISGINLMEYSSSAARAVLDNLRTILIWFYFLLIPQSSNYEELEETFKYLQLLGFILIIIGNLIYNEILDIKYLGLSKCYKTKEDNKNDNKRDIQNELYSV